MPTKERASSAQQEIWFYMNPVVSPHNGLVMQSFDIYPKSNKLLNVTVMITLIH